MGSSSPAQLGPVLYAKVPHTISFSKEVLQLRKQFEKALIILCFDFTLFWFLTQLLFLGTPHIHGRCGYMVCSAKMLLG